MGQFCFKNQTFNTLLCTHYSPHKCADILWTSNKSPPSDNLILRQSA